MPSSKNPKEWLLKKLKAPVSRLRNKKNTPNISVSASAPDLQMSPQQGSSFAVNDDPRPSDIGLPDQTPSGPDTPVVPDDTHIQNQNQAQTSASMAEPPNVQQQDQDQNMETGSEVVSADETSAEKKPSGQGKTAFQLTAKSLGILKEFSDFIPVPGIGAAIGSVKKCIEVYLQITDNDEQIIKLAQELKIKLQTVEKHSAQAGDSEMKKHFDALKR
ncbi:hypothetical protein VKT23_014073 [Stygiomarasmius scandens]|uniref:Uncharacterized protein n=1 Tax=Marasmiellus scandens TaxID=2682957 RepID=A0ABR1J1F9_9AGAR